MLQLPLKILTHQAAALSDEYVYVLECLFEKIANLGLNPKRVVFKLQYINVEGVEFQTEFTNPWEDVRKYEEFLNVLKKLEAYQEVIDFSDEMEFWLVGQTDDTITVKSNVAFHQHRGSREYHNPPVSEPSPDIIILKPNRGNHHDG